MELVAQQDPFAQRTLVHRLMRRVRRATGALLRNPADADDAAQVCMLEVLRSAKSFRGEGSLESWTDRIVARTALRYAKSRARSHQRLDRAADPDALSRPREDQPLADGLPRNIDEYLAQLSEPRRTAIILRHVFDYSIDEIAEITQVSRNTVKDRLLTARREFRRMIRRDQAVGAASSRRTA